MNYIKMKYHTGAKPKHKTVQEYHENKANAKIAIEKLKSTVRDRSMYETLDVIQKLSSPSLEYNYWTVTDTGRKKNDKK
jgi:hypothetical protein